MNLQRRRPRTVVLALAALGLASFFAAAAQAEWIIEKEKLTTPETVTGSAHVATNLLVPTKNLEILCEKHTIKEGTLLTNGEGDGVLLLTECKTRINGVISAGCKPTEPVVATGHAKPILHEGSTYLLIEPKGSEPFATAEFNEETCALPSRNKITGSAVAECLNEKLEKGKNLCETELVIHLGQEASHALFPGHEVKFGANPVTFDGIAAVLLNGAKKGKKFSFVI